MGRPGTGAYFRDIEKVAMALAKLRPHFEKENPVTQLMVDTETGKMKEEILNEKVLSAIIEIKTNLEKIPEFLQILEKVQKRDRYRHQCRRGLSMSSGWIDPS